MSLNTIKVSCVVPAYNAEDTLESVIERIPKNLWQHIQNVWIINDGSQDKTGEVIEILKGRYQAIKPVLFQRNRGYGGVVAFGLQQCRDDGCDYACCLHADGQYPPESIADFITCMAEKDIDILQGSRIASKTALSGGMPLYKYLCGRVLTFCENRVFSLSMSDYHSGMLCYSKRALHKIPFYWLSTSFDFDLEAIASAKTIGLTIDELPIPTKYGTEVSYLNPLTYGLRVCMVMVKYSLNWYRSAQ